jgi:DNA-binding response OmpR family regulator
MRLLLAEDDCLLGAAIRVGMSQSGFVVDWTRTGHEAESALRSQSYDCVLLDLGLPDVSGETLLKRMRTGHVAKPVIVITARADLQDRINVLNQGADDYMVKPFDLLELEARLRAVMRRCDADQHQTTVLQHAGVRLCPTSHTATWHGSPLNLTKKEFWLLEIFLRKKGQVVSRAQLEDALYGWDDEIDSNAVEVFIHHLRRKLGHDFIRTIRGLGYRLCPAN